MRALVSDDSLSSFHSRIALTSLMSESLKWSQAKGAQLNGGLAGGSPQTRDTSFLLGLAKRGPWQELGGGGPGKKTFFWLPAQVCLFSSLDLSGLQPLACWRRGAGTAPPWQGEQLLGQALKSKNIPMSLAPSLPGVLPWASLQQVGWPVSLPSTRQAGPLRKDCSSFSFVAPQC